MKLSDFHNGQKVSFTTDEGNIKTGVILKLNKKRPPYSPMITCDGMYTRIFQRNRIKPFAPASVYAYAAGVNTLDQKLKQILHK